MITIKTFTRDDEYVSHLGIFLYVEDNEEYLLFASENTSGDFEMIAEIPSIIKEANRIAKKLSLELIVNKEDILELTENI